MKNKIPVGPYFGLVHRADVLFSLKHKNGIRKNVRNNIHFEVIVTRILNFLF